MAVIYFETCAEVGVSPTLPFNTDTDIGLSLCICRIIGKVEIRLADTKCNIGADFFGLIKVVETVYVPLVNVQIVLCAIVY